MENFTIRQQEISRIAQEALPLPLPRRQQRPEPRVEPVDGSATSGFEASLPSPKGEAAATADNLESLQRITDDLNKFFSEGKGIRFQVSPDTHNLVVQVIDRASEKVIRSIPPERLVSFRDNFREISNGILLDNEA